MGNASFLLIHEFSSCTDLDPVPRVQKMFRDASLPGGRIELWRNDLVYGIAGREEEAEGSNTLSSLLHYDAQTQKITLTTKAGTLERLWYFRTEKVFACSNDLALLRKHASFPAELDLQQIWDYLSLLYVPSGSVYKFVHCLTGGEALCWDMKCREWNKTSFHAPREWINPEKAPSYKECCAELDRRVRESVRASLEQIPEDEDAGVFLSGGIDSAILAGLASEMREKPIHCCSIAFSRKEYDEREGALKSAAHLQRYTGKKIFHHIQELDAPSDFSFLESLIRRYGQPFADSSLIPTALLCRFAASYSSVFLGGDGADELFRGYERYIAMRYLSKSDFLPAALRRALFGGLLKLLPSSGGNTERTRTARICRFLKAGEKDPASRYYSLISHGSEELKRRLCTESFASQIPSITERTFDPEGFFQRHNDVSLFDVKTYLPGDCLTKTAIASKGCPLRVETPFLAEKVMNYALGLPAGYKEKNAYRKRILCDTFSPYLYEGLAHGKKRGFGVPLAYWMRNEWKTLLRETLLSGEGIRQEVFSASGVETLLREHSSGAADHSYILYCALILELFLRNP